MPYSFEIPLRLVSTLPEAGGEPGRALHALVFRWLESAEPRVANFVHTQAEPKPFTLSPLLTGSGGAFHFRVTLLEDGLGEYLLRGMKSSQTVRIADKILQPEPPSRREHTTYAEFMATAALDPEAVLRFESPTSFRTRGLDDPLPNPRRIFQSYLSRWNAFAPERLEAAEEFYAWVEQHVAVSRLDLHTAVLEFQKHVQIGSVGQVSLAVVHTSESDREWVRWVNRLADYAYYCGTGHKTTQGMGQTRRVGGVNKT